MLAEMAMFIQLLGMATLAAILPTIIVMCAIYLITHTGFKFGGLSKASCEQSAGR